MAITNDEKQSIINAVLSSIRTNSRTIDQLTIVTEVADTDNFEIHGGKRVAFSKLRELILSKSGVGAINDKLPELDDVVEFKEVRNDITLIATQQTSVLGGIAGSTDAGYGAVYDPTRKRFFLMYYGEEAQTDASVVIAYGNFADEDRFGASPSSGGGRVPVSGKLYLCKNDGGLYHWNGADLVVVAAKKHAITLQQAVAGTGAWSGPAFDDIRVGDTLTFTDTETQTATVFCEYKTSANARALCAAYAHANETNSVIMLLWLTDSGTYGKGGLPTSQTVVDWLDKKQKTLAATTDVKVQSADEDTDGLYLTDSAKRAVFNDMWLSIGGEKLANGKYRMTDSGKELTFAEALVRYNRNGFIDQWNEAAGPYGHYNEETGFFELNGLTDITYEEAMRILVDSVIRTTNCIDLYFKKDIRTRTLIPTILCGHFVFAENCDSMYARCYTLTVIQLAAGNKTDPCPTNIKSMFSYCSSLKEISGILDLYNITAERTVRDAFSGCTKLESVKIKRLNISISFSSCENLSFTSLQFMVTNAANSAAITITVHPDVYAKLTGDTTNPAVAALTPSEFAQWQQILTAATAKNISFTTP